MDVRISRFQSIYQVYTEDNHDSIFFGSVQPYNWRSTCLLLKACSCCSFVVAFYIYRCIPNMESVVPDQKHFRVFSVKLKQMTWHYSTYYLKGNNWTFWTVFQQFQWTVSCHVINCFIGVTVHASIHWERAGLAVECRTPNQEDPSLISHWGRRVVSLNKTQ